MAEQLQNLDLLMKVAQDPKVLELEGIAPPPVNWWPEWSTGLLGGEEVAEVRADQLESAQLARMIRNWTNVSIRKGTRLLDLTVDHQVPGVASVLADKLAEVYSAELGRDRDEGRTTSSGTLVKKSAEAEKLLEQKENALANYQIILSTLADLEKRESTFSELDLRYLSKHPKLIAAKNALE